MRREGAVRRHYARVALPLMLVALSVTVIQYQIPTIMERVMDEFSMDAGSASWLMSVFTLVGIVAALPVGGLAGRVGAKRLMVGAAFLASLATLASAFADGAPMLLALRALEGPQGEQHGRPVGERRGQGGKAGQERRAHHESFRPDPSGKAPDGQGGDNPDEREHRHEPRSAAGIHRELVHDAFHDGGYLVLDNRHGQRDQHERQRHPRIVPAHGAFAPHGRPPRASWPNREAAGPPASRVPRAFPAPPAASALPEHRARRERPAWGALRPGAGRRRTRSTSGRPRHRLRRTQGRSCRGRPWLV